MEENRFIYHYENVKDNDYDNKDSYELEEVKKIRNKYIKENKKINFTKL